MLHRFPYPKRRKIKWEVGSGDWQWYNPEIWDLNSDSLIPIKEFLKEHLL